jgi:hypothetical protein
MSKPSEKPQRTAPPLTVDPNQAYSMPEAAAIRRECRAQTYKAIKAGKLLTFKRGRRRYCMGAELIAKVQS